MGIYSNVFLHYFTPFLYKNHVNVLEEIWPQCLRNFMKLDIGNFHVSEQGTCDVLHDKSCDMCNLVYKVAALIYLGTVLYDV